MEKKNVFYEGIMEGLNELIEETKTGKKTLKRTRLSIEVVPVKQYSASEVKSIRNAVGMSQKVFAEYLGVSKKTVEAWEAGINSPSGSSSRMLSMFEINNNLANDFPFVTVN